MLPLLQLLGLFYHDHWPLQAGVKPSMCPFLDFWKKSKLKKEGNIPNMNINKKFREELIACFP
jgi:hypothetical protein